MSEKYECRRNVSGNEEVDKRGIPYMDNQNGTADVPYFVYILQCGTELPQCITYILESAKKRPDEQTSETYFENVKPECHLDRIQDSYS